MDEILTVTPGDKTSVSEQQPVKLSAAVQALAEVTGVAGRGGVVAGAAVDITAAQRRWSFRRRQR
ncbi:hypothetical protein ACVBEQ_23400 [Nakamurella sp. GG22]